MPGAPQLRGGEAGTPAQGPSPEAPVLHYPSGPHLPSPHHWLSEKAEGGGGDAQDHTAHEKQTGGLPGPQPVV